MNGHGSVGENSLPSLRRWDICCQGRRQSLPQPFVTSEEEGLVPLDWPAQCPTELISPERRGVRAAVKVSVYSVEEVPSIHCTVAYVFKRAPMQFIGPRARDSRHYRSRGPSEF